MIRLMMHQKSFIKVRMEYQREHSTPWIGGSAISTRLVKPTYGAGHYMADGSFNRVTIASGKKIVQCFGVLSLYISFPGRVQVYLVTAKHIHMGAIGVFLDIQFSDSRRPNSKPTGPQACLFYTQNNVQVSKRILTGSRIYIMYQGEYQLLSNSNLRLDWKKFCSSMSALFYLDTQFYSVRFVFTYINISNILI